MADFDPSSKPSRTRAFIEAGTVRDDDPSRRSLGFGEQRESVVSQYQQWRDVGAHGPCSRVEQVLKVLVPTPTSSAGTPTLAEVRWTRKLPFGSSKNDGAYFVGLKFLF